MVQNIPFSVIAYQCEAIAVHSHTFTSVTWLTNEAADTINVLSDFFLTRKFVSFILGSLMTLHVRFEEYGKGNT